MQISTNSYANAKHANRYVKCEVGVVYNIPLTCGKTYVGQTGICLNERLKEHRCACQKMAPSGNLAKHCKNYERSPLFEKTSFLAKSQNETTREIWAAFNISSQQSICVSSCSIVLTPPQIDFIKSSSQQVYKKKASRKEYCFSKRDTEFFTRLQSSAAFVYQRKSFYTPPLCICIL